MLLKDRNIFIVEDNLQNRVVFQVALTRYGALVEFDRFGKDVVHRLNYMGKIDIIILDLMLAEGVSGFDLYDEIRALPKFSVVPIISVSAMDPALAIPKMRPKGFAGFIAKPIDSYLFAKQIARIIDGEQVWYTGGNESSTDE
jgi:CheY-like chemotaxis protein